MSVVRTDPYKNFNFRVEIDGVTESSFDWVELPAGEIAVVEYREGGDKDSVARRLPGRVDYSNVVLRRGVNGSLTFYDWWNSVRNGVVDKRSLAIVLLDEKGSEVQRWLVQGAWPVDLSWSELDGLDDDTLCEQITLTYDRFEVE